MIKDPFQNLIAKYSTDEAFNAECWKEIYTSYTSKSRYYHNLEHLEKMINELKPVANKTMDMDTILFSIYYHDIIYQATKSNNESMSAALFKERISKTTFPSIEKCCQQIEATKAHQKSTDPDTNILLDLDLAILGSDELAYKTYTQNVRKEYSIYPDFMYRKGRKKVLAKILASDSIYKTDYFIDFYEAKARRNLNNELNLLA